MIISTKNFVYGRKSYRDFISKPFQTSSSQPLPVVDRTETENITDTDLSHGTNPSYTQVLFPSNTVSSTKSFPWTTESLRRDAGWERGKHYETSYNYPILPHTTWAHQIEAPINPHLIHHVNDWTVEKPKHKYIPEAVSRWLSQKLRVEIEYKTIAKVLLKLLVVAKVFKVILIVVILLMVPMLKKMHHDKYHMISNLTTSNESSYNDHRYRHHHPIHDLLYRHLEAHKRHKRKPHSYEHKYKPKSRPKPSNSSSSPYVGLNVNCTHNWAGSLNGATSLRLCDENGNCSEDRDWLSLDEDTFDIYDNDFVRAARAFQILSKNSKLYWKFCQTMKKMNKTFLGEGLPKKLSDIGVVLVNIYNALTLGKQNCKNRNDIHCQLLRVMDHVDQVYKTRE